MLKVKERFYFDAGKMPAKIAMAEVSEISGYYAMIDCYIKEDDGSYKPIITIKILAKICHQTARKYIADTAAIHAERYHA